MCSEAYAVAGGPGAAAVMPDPPWQDWLIDSDPPSRWAEAPTHWDWRRKRR